MAGGVHQVFDVQVLCLFFAIPVVIGAFCDILVMQSLDRHMWTDR